MRLISREVERVPRVNDRVLILLIDSPSRSLNLSGYSTISVRRRFPAYTLLELEPLTGRTHQLRIHCTSIGHPLFGDQIYGRRDDEEAERFGVKHHLLHAQRLIFRHPTYDRELDLQAPLPPQILEMILNVS